jgi:polyribonucleotide nucleotidyltransferase
MKLESKKVEKEIGGRILSLETGKIAKQADSSIMVRYGDTMVLVAVVSAPMRFEADFFPLRVDYREMTYAAGKFPGGFFKREGRPTQKEILTCRLMDRPIRPLFPKGYRQDVMISGTVLSADGENDPDILAMIGSSASLYCAPEIPFFGPTGTVRVGLVGDEVVINPTTAQMADSPMNLVVAGTEDAIGMLEGQTEELSEEIVLKAILKAHEAIRDIIALQKELGELIGATMPEYSETEASPLIAELEGKYFDRVLEAHQVIGKFQRKDALKAIEKEAVEEYVKEDVEDGPTKDEIGGIFDGLEKKACRDLIMKQDKREDGRGLDEVRPIACEVGILPTVHGSALFTRGETQALCSCTLGTPSDEQRIDGLGEEMKKKFMLHYNFPAYSVGECRPPRGPGRREIGHGMLAERSLENVIPSKEDFPYTLRIVSEIMESNGSSSQASVCGGTLALMDAGVPISQPVAGVAMGLVSEGGVTKVLTDICGSEDHFGDMDLKIAGTQNGITTIQMDLKVTGVTEETLLEAFTRARGARIHVLKQMLTALSRPREEISSLAPRMLLVKIPEDKIGAVIGPGGKIIKGIQEQTGAKLDIEDDGSVHISCLDAAGAEDAAAMVRGITEEPEIGKVYKGKVTGIKDFGAFVEILPGRDGLVHISELSDGYVKDVDSVVKLGDELTVKILNVDDQGKIRLSRKALLLEEKAAEGGEEKPSEEQ